MILDISLMSQTLNSFIDPSWIGVLLGFISILITIWGTIWGTLTQRTRKEIAYEIISNFPVLSIGKEIDGRLKFEFDNKPVQPVRDLHCVILKILNTGDVQIDVNDFIGQINLNFIGDVSVLSAKILRPNYIGADKIKILDVQNIEIEPQLFNIKDAIELEVILSGNIKDVKMHSRISGVSRILDLNKVRQEARYIRMRLFVTAIIIFLMAAGIYFSVRINNAFSSATLATLGGIASLLWLFPSLTRKLGLKSKNISQSHFFLGTMQKLGFRSVAVYLIILMMFIFSGRVGWLFYTVQAHIKIKPITTSFTPTVPVRATSTVTSLGTKTLYMAWKGIGSDPHIYWANFNGKFWTSQQTVPHVGTDSTPALATFHNKLYMFWKDLSGDPRIYWASFDGKKWSQQNYLNVETSNIPSLISFQDKLYMVWKGFAGDQQIYWTSFDGTAWFSQQTVPHVTTNSGPALTLFNDKLLMVWSGTAVNQQIYWSEFDGVGWSPQIAVPGAYTSTAPTVTTFMNTLYIAWKAEGKDTNLHWITYNNAGWSYQQAIQGVGSDNTPVLTTFNDKLYLTWKGISGDPKIYWASFDGKKWSQQVSISNVGTNSAPALAEF